MKSGLIQRPFQDGTSTTGFTVATFLLPGGQALTLIFCTTFSLDCPAPKGFINSFNVSLTPFGIYDAISENWEEMAIFD